MCARISWLLGLEEGKNLGKGEEEQQQAANEALELILEYLQVG